MSNLKIYNLFPTTILSTILNNIDTNDISLYQHHFSGKEYSNTLNEGMYSKNNRVLDHPLFSKLKNEILNFSKKYLNNLGHVFEDLQIGSSWVNILNKKNTIKLHQHTNSYISGVFYLDSSSSIIFDNPLISKWFFSAVTKRNSKNFCTFNDFEIKPSSKQLVLFPSFLYHKVLPSDTNDRISIAFNIIPKGEFGHDTQKLYLK